MRKQEPETNVRPDLRFISNLTIHVNLDGRMFDRENLTCGVGFVIISSVTLVLAGGGGGRVGMRDSGAGSSSLGKFAWALRSFACDSTGLYITLR